MSSKPKVTPKNIASFLEGNAKFYYNKFIGSKPYIKEQVKYRLSFCGNDCIPEGKCKYCGCPPMKKAFVNKSCNKGERFPDLMGEKEWEEFKIKNKINA